MPGRPRVALTLTQCWHRVPGGSATSILRLAATMAGRGEVDLVGVLSRGDVRRPGSLRRGALPDEPWTPPVPVARMPLPLPILYDSWARSGRPSIETSTGPVDLVHLTVPMQVPVGRAPVVATVHDLFPLRDPDRLTARGARLTAAGIDWIRARASVVMVPSATVAEQCVEEGFAQRRLRVVPWGAEVSEPAPDRVAEVRRRLGATAPYVLFVGTIEPRKNLATLLRAMALVDRPDLTLVIAGPQGWGGSIEDELAAVPGPVVRTGFVPESDLTALQRGAAVCCYPSLAEGFGLPVLEAMAVGAAVVTSRGTATEEVAGDGALLVDPSSSAELAAAIARLLDDDALAESLRGRAVRRAGELTWDEAARRTIEVYREVLA